MIEFFLVVLQILVCAGTVCGVLCSPPVADNECRTLMGRAAAEKLSVFSDPDAVFSWGWFHVHPSCCIVEWLLYRVVRGLTMSGCPLIPSFETADE